MFSNHRFAFLFVVLSSGLPAVASEEGDDSRAVRLERVFTALEHLGYSGALAVVEGGEPLLRRGFGVADRVSGTRIDTETIFDCGSITKQFTATAILALEAAGELKVEDSIDRFFREVPADKQGITLHHLLTHSSGFPGAIGNDEEPIGSVDYLVRAFATPLQSTPGERYDYSNVGYSILGLVVEKVSGKPYEAYLRERLFLPIGIETAGYLLPTFELDSVAKIYDGDREWGRVYRNHWASDGPGWHLRANGGLHLRADDMLRWIDALQDDTLLPAAQREKMFTAQIDEGGGESFYGYGWVIEDGPNGKVIHHNGGNGVFSANVRFVPAIDRRVFVVSTQKDWNADDLMDCALAILNGDSELEPPDIVPIAPDHASKLEGSYRSAEGTTIEVVARGSMLRLIPSDAAADALLFAPDDATRTKYAALATRVEAFLRAALDGDYAPLYAATGRRRSLEETGTRFRDLLDGAEADHGKFKDLAVLGVRPLDEWLGVWVSLEFERGKLVTAYAFDFDKVIGQLVTDRAPSVDLAHVGDGAFRTFSLDPNSPSLTLTFATDSDGEHVLTLGASGVTLRPTR